MYDYNQDQDITLYTVSELQAMLNIWNGKQGMIFNLNPIFGKDEIESELNKRNNKVKMQLLKDFDDAMINKIIRKFSHWESENLIIVHGSREKTAEDTFGLAYTSSSAYAALWNTNVKAVSVNDYNLVFEGIGYNAEELEPVAIFTKYDEDGNEIEDVFITF